MSSYGCQRGIFKPWVIKKVTVVKIDCSHSWHTYKRDETDILLYWGCTINRCGHFQNPNRRGWKFLVKVKYITNQDENEVPQCCRDILTYKPCSPKCKKNMSACAGKRLIVLMVMEVKINTDTKWLLPLIKSHITIETSDRNDNLIYFFTISLCNFKQMPPNTTFIYL